jgi:histidinol phosphatase-like enzyme
MQIGFDNDLDLRKCVVIGDRWSDLVAAKEAGCTKILVKTGAGEKDLAKYQQGQYFGNYKESYPDFIAESFRDAVVWIVNNCAD